MKRGEDLDRRGWNGLCGQAATRGHRPRRSVRRERFDRCVPLDHRSDAGADLQALRPPQCPEWTACAMPDDGGRADCRAEETPWKAGRLTGLRRSEGAQPRHVCIPGFGGNGRVARLASRRVSEPRQRSQPARHLVPTGEDLAHHPAPLTPSTTYGGAALDPKRDIEPRNPGGGRQSLAQVV